MLPTIAMLKNTAIAGIAALGVAVTAAAPAQAFGDKERAFVQGVATAVIVDKLIENGRQQQRQPQYRYAPAPQRYYDQQPRYYQQPRRQTHAPQPMYLAPSYSTYQTPAAQAFSEYTPATRRAIQATLADYGYYRSGIDGRWGPGTARAVDAYARGEGSGYLLDSRDGAVRLFNGLLR